MDRQRRRLRVDRRVRRALRRRSAVAAAFVAEREAARQALLHGRHLGVTLRPLQSLPDAVE